MMAKALIVIGLIPCVLSFLVAHFFGVRNLRKGVNLAINGEDLARALLKRIDVEVKVTRSWWIAKNPLVKSVYHINESLASSHGLIQLATVAHQCGLVHLELIHERSVHMHYRTLRFASIFPLFVTIGMVFARFVGRVNSMMCVAVILVALGFTCATCLLNLAVQREATRRALREIDEQSPIKRFKELELLERAIAGVAYLNILPVILRPFVMPSLKSGPPE